MDWMIDRKRKNKRIMNPWELAFVEVSDSRGCVLEGHPKRKTLLLTYSVCKNE